LTQNAAKPFPATRKYVGICPGCHHNVTPHPDDVGEELPDDATAWHEATIITGELFKDIDGKFQPGQEWSLEVTDDQRRSLYFIVISARKMSRPLVARSFLQTQVLSQRLIGTSGDTCRP
jgi:hypothetical protein